MNLKTKLTGILSPFIDKVAQDIEGIKSNLDISAKSINAVTYGIDNTGATDVSDKLNELFTKVYNEDYEEVIFPDGIYKISKMVNILCPDKPEKSLAVRSKNKYGAVITITNPEDGSSDYIGLRLTTKEVEDTSENLHAYNITIDGFAFKLDDAVASGSQIKFINNDIITNSVTFTGVALKNLKMKNHNDSLGQNIDFSAPVNDLLVENLDVTYGMNSFQLQYSDGLNNKARKIVSKNCTGHIAAYSFIDLDDILLHFDEDYDVSQAFTSFIYSNLINGLKLTGKWNLGNYLLDINVGATPTINNISLDISNLAEEAQPITERTAFIHLTSPHSAKVEVKLSDITFANFEEKFATLIEKGDKFTWLSCPDLAISYNNIETHNNLKVFENLGSVNEYSSKGFLNRKYEELAEHDAKSRIYLGYDRTIEEKNNTKVNVYSDKEGSAIFFGANGSPAKDNKDHDLSNYGAGVSGDIYLETNPKKTGHLGYVSTHSYTNFTPHLSGEELPISVVNHGDRTVTIGFSKFPVWTNGSFKGQPIGVGSEISVLAKTVLTVTEVDIDAKTLKASIPEHVREDIIKELSDFSAGVYFMPGRNLNTLANMGYETIPVIHSGPTENRPTEHVAVGQQYFDTTIGLQVVWDGTKWIANNVDIDTKLAEYVRKDSIVATDTTKAPAFVGQIGVSDAGTICIAESATGPESWRIVVLQPNDHL